MSRSGHFDESMANDLRRRNRLLIAIACLGVGALLAYASSFNVPLLFDDWVTILHNPRLRQVWPLWSALSPPEFTGVGGRPIANLSFVLNYALTGEAVWGFHAVNLLIHFLAGLTLFGVVRRTLARTTWPRRGGVEATWVALAAAAVWMLHPVQTQSVTYISQRTESLMGLFYFLTLYAFIRATEPAGLKWAIVAVLSCFAGMATKEGMVTVPAIAFLYDYVFVTRSWREAWHQRWKLYAVFASSWVLLVWLMSGLKGRGVGFGLGMSVWSYWLVECRAVIRYLALAVWPSPLVFDYGVDLAAPGWVEALAAAGIVLLVIATLLALWRAPEIGFLGAWFLITLSPTSSIVPIPLQPISENRVYLPTAAVAVGIAVLIFSSQRRVRAACTAIALAFVLLTAVRNGDYRSEIGLWADTVVKRPTSSRAHSNYGFALQSIGRLAEAKQEHERALQLRPNYSEAHSNLAAIVGQLGHVDQAIEHSRRAIAIDPRNAGAYFNLGVGLAQAGKDVEAIAAYEGSLRVRPESPETHDNLALLLLRVGRVNDAIAHSREALRLRPGFTSAKYSLACGLGVTGRAPEAVALLVEVVRAMPNHLGAWQNLGVLLLQQGRGADAVAAGEAAARLAPNDAAAHFLLANALLASGRAAEAVPHYETTLRLSPNAAEAHLNLGLAYGQLGRRDDAIARLTDALRLNPNLKAAQENLDRLRNQPPPPKP